MATKNSTIFSTNPKMDTSGVSTSSPQYGYMGQSLQPKPVSGGKLYMEAIKEQEGGKADALTTPQNMRAAAKYVSQGLSCDHAFDVVGEEKLKVPDKVDVIKAVSKSVLGRKKGY